MEPSLEKRAAETGIESNEEHNKIDSDPVDRGVRRFERRKIKGLLNQCLHVSKDATKRFAKFCRQRQKLIRHYSVVAAVVLFVATLFQNIELSNFDFLFWSVTAPKIVLYIIMLAVGSVFGYWLRGRDPSEFKGRRDVYENVVH